MTILIEIAVFAIVFLLAWFTNMTDYWAGNCLFYVVLYGLGGFIVLQLIGLLIDHQEAVGSFILANPVVPVIAIIAIIVIIVKALNN